MEVIEYVGKIDDRMNRINKNYKYIGENIHNYINDGKIEYKQLMDFELSLQNLSIELNKLVYVFNQFDNNETNVNNENPNIINTILQLSNNINQNNSVSYSSSYSKSSYNRSAANAASNVDDANNEIYSANIGYNYSFSDVNLISSKISYTEKKAKKNYNAYTGPSFNIGYTRILPFGTLKLDKTFETNTYEEKDTFVHSTISREDDIETSQIQLSGRITQLIPFIKKFDLESKIFYNFKYTEIDSDSSLLQNSSMRKNTSFNLIKRFSLYE